MRRRSLMMAKQVGPWGSKPDRYQVLREQIGDEAFLSVFHQGQQVVDTTSKAGYNAAARSSPNQRNILPARCVCW